MLCNMLRVLRLLAFFCCVTSLAHLRWASLASMQVLYPQGPYNPRPNFEKKNQKIDTDETSVSAREEIIEHNML